MGNKNSKKSAKESPKAGEEDAFSSYQPKILVVGAGAAGLACATKLLHSGFTKVTVLEAERRIGGRIFTVPFGDNVVDLGAQWCHGEVNNVVYGLMEELNLLDTTGEIYANIQSIRSNGEIVPEATVNQLKHILSTILLKRSDEISSYNGSLEEYLSMHYYNELLNEEYKDIEFIVAKEFFDNFKKMEGADALSDQDEMSAFGMEEYWICDGDYFLNFKDKGFYEFLRVLMQADKMGNELGLLEGRVLFGRVVENIFWRRSDGQVELQCAGIENFIADHVVITCSLGVLKHHLRTMFIPDLPEWKTKAIASLGYANVGKIYLEFAKPFWSEGWNGFITLWRKEDILDLAGTKHAWMLDVFGFYCVNYQPRLLIGWIVGRHVEVMESMSQAEVKAGCLKLLQRFLVSWKVPEPQNIIMPDWSINPHFYGSYSYRSLKTEATNSKAYTLGQPLSELVYDITVKKYEATSTRRKTYKPKVLFAGEATSSHYYGTVHGAVESGWREANRLVGYYLKEL